MFIHATVVRKTTKKVLDFLGVFAIVVGSIRNTHMKKIVSALMAFALFAVSTQAAMLTINWAPVHSPNGGAFLVTPDTGDAFQTFCLERNEYISLGGTYSYQIADATDGGINGGPDPVSIGTAWLYSNFRNGTLPGFTGTSSQMDQLQNTFWYLEGELSSLGNTAWLNAAQLALPNFNLLSDADGLYGVGVWNLYTSSGGHAQSQLSYTVPEPATWWAGACLLLPFGLSTLRCFRSNPLSK